MAERGGGGGGGGGGGDGDESESGVERMRLDRAADLTSADMPTCNYGHPPRAAAADADANWYLVAVQRLLHVLTQKEPGGAEDGDVNRGYIVFTQELLFERCYQTLGSAASTSSSRVAVSARQLSAWLDKGLKKLQEAAGDTGDVRDVLQRVRETPRAATKALLAKQFGDGGAEIALPPQPTIFRMDKARVASLLNAWDSSRNSTKSMGAESTL